MNEAGYAGGLLGIFKRGIRGIPDDLMNGRRRQAITLNQALAMSERNVTVAQQQQLATQSVALAQSFQIMGARLKEIGINGIFLTSIRAKTAALGAEAVAARVATGAMLPLAAASTVATAGFNILFALLTVGVPLLAGFASTAESASEKIDRLTDATKEKTDTASKEIDENAQVIAQRQKQVELMDKAIEYYIRDVDAMKKATEGSEEWEKANKGAKNAEESLIKAFDEGTEDHGRNAVERIKNSDNIRAAFEKEKDAFLKGTDAKKKSPDELRQQQKEDLTERVAAASKQIDIYKADLAAFGNWKDEQLKGLDDVQSAWARFWQFIYNGLGGDALEKKGAVSEWGKSILGFAKRQATGDLEDELKKAEEERSQVQSQLSGLKNSLLDDDVYSGHTDPGAIVAGDSDEKSGKNKKPSKVVEQYNTVAMRFLGAIAAQDSRFKTSVLHAASGYILGGGSNWKDIDANTINPLGVTQEELQSVIPDGDMENPENVARAFVLLANEFNGSAEEFLDDWLQRIGLAKEAVEAAAIRGKIMNQAEYFENGDDKFGGIDYNKKKNTFAIDDRMTSLKTATFYQPTGGMGAMPQSRQDVRKWVADITGQQMPDAVFDKIISTGQELKYTPEELKLALAVAAAESNGVQDVTSKVGAHGIFQLTPETAEELGVNAYDWEQNIYGGMKYLQEQIDRYGSWQLAAAAYNAGPGNVKGGVIPNFGETPKYVAKIGEYLSRSAGYKENSEYEMPRAPMESSVEELKEGWSSILPWIGGVLRYQFGYDPMITSAARTQEHQMRINPSAPNSHHIIRENGGNAVDISLAEHELTPEQEEEVRRYFEQSGLFDEVLYHAVVGGRHLHPGGLRNEAINQVLNTNAAMSAQAFMPLQVAYQERQGKLLDFWSGQNNQFKWHGLDSIVTFNRFAQYEKASQALYRDLDVKLAEVQRMRHFETQRQNLMYANDIEGRLGKQTNAYELPFDYAEYNVVQDYIKQLEYDQAYIKKLRDRTTSYIEQYHKSHQEIDAFLDRRSQKWEKLSVDQQVSVVENLGGKEVADAIKMNEELRKSWEGITDKLEEYKQKLVDIRYHMATIGLPETMKPEQLEQYALKDAELTYKGDTIGAIYENPKRRKEYLEEQIEIYKARRDRLTEKKGEEDARYVEQLDRLETRWNEAKADEQSLLQRQDSGENVTEELRMQSELVKRLQEDYTRLSNTGTQGQKDIEQQIKETDNAIKELEADLYPVETQLKKTLADGVTNMFDDILIKGNSFKDAWNNLWQSIASMALKQLLIIQMQKWLPNLFGGADGGEVESKAKGGYIRSFATGGSFADIPSYRSGKQIDAGLIKGAGTGTSDSILTYLENRGQFIRTSDGEFIIKKKSVDELGLSFLNRLNENPEQIAQKEKILKAYAGGGSLGAEMEPVMSERTVSNFNSYTKMQADKEDRSARQEKLLETISLQLSTFTQPVNENTTMHINAVDSKSFVQLLSKHSDVIMGLMRKERGKRNYY